MKLLFLCRLGLHADGMTVSGWADDGTCVFGFRCGRCHQVLHAFVNTMIDPIPPARVTAQRKLSREMDGPFYWEPPVTSSHPTRPSTADLKENNDG